MRTLTPWRGSSALLDEPSFSEDDGPEISLALEAGAAIPEQCLERFLAPLRQMKKIIVADGLLLRHLKQWLPNSNIVSLGEALSGHAAVRRGLRATDLYVIEPRAYHSDYQRLVKHYDGCALLTAAPSISTCNASPFLPPHAVCRSGLG